jgi:hypothetical protein
MIEVKMMIKIILILIGAVFHHLAVSKPTNEADKGFFFKWKDKR